MKDKKEMREQERRRRKQDGDKEKSKPRKNDLPYFVIEEIIGKK